MVVGKKLARYLVNTVIRFGLKLSILFAVIIFTAVMASGKKDANGILSSANQNQPPHKRITWIAPALCPSRPHIVESGYIHLKCKKAGKTERQNTFRASNTPTSKYQQDTSKSRESVLTPFFAVSNS